ncbi:MAG: glycosyltransferase family 2 protein [Sphingomonadaceae bacterium]|nr:glycosyltransferase family 2 protein [Sphingomonadaceae bacterium]
MCVFNAQDHVESATFSIRNQTFSDFEFLIPDDGSTDGTATILHRHAAEDNRLRIIHQPNRGVVASLNLLIESAQSDLLARMYGDDIAAPHRLALQVQAMRAEPDIVALESWARLIDAAGRPTGRITSTPNHHAPSHRALIPDPALRAAFDRTGI